MKHPRKAKDTLEPMMSNGRFYGSNTLTDVPRRVGPIEIKNAAYLCHDMHDHTVVAVALHPAMEWEGPIDWMQCPQPSVILSPKDPEKHWRWLVWELKFPVSRNNVAATVYWRDTMYKMSRAFTGTDPLSFRYIGNPFNHDVWNIQHHDRLYSLSDICVVLNNGLRQGEYTEEEYRELIRDLTNRSTFHLMRLRREGAERVTLENLGEEKVKWCLAEFNYSEKMFGTDLRLEVSLYIDYLLSHPVEHWTSRFSEIQAERGSRKGYDDRTRLFPDALRLRREGFSDRQIGRLLYKDHKTIGNWFRAFDEERALAEETLKLLDV